MPAPFEKTKEAVRLQQSQDDKDLIKIRVIRNGYLLSTNYGKMAFMNVPDLLKEVEKILSSDRAEVRVIR